MKLTKLKVKKVWVGRVFILGTQFREAPNDFHIGFFWGNTPSDNKFWHSYYPDGNIISDIKTKSPAEKIYVFHNAKEEGYISLKKVNDNDDNMAGVSCRLTADGKSTTVKTDANGNLKSPNLVVEYEETATIAGHYIDTAHAKRSLVVKSDLNTIVISKISFQLL